MKNTEMITTTESKTFGNQLIVAAIHQAESVKQEPAKGLKMISANITRVRIEEGKMIYQRDGFTVQGDTAAPFSIKCTLSKQAAKPE